MTLSPVEPGTPAFAELRSWLEAERLATDDLAEGAPRFFRLSDPAGGTLGFAGLSGVGPQRLLRSVVIRPDTRGSGAGARLVAAVEAAARADGAACLWLLTQGAAPFFGRMGFVAAERPDAPPVIRDTAQFQGLCPASAALLCKTLR